NSVSCDMAGSSLPKVWPCAPPSTIGNIVIFGIVPAMKLRVLALDGVFDTGLSAVLDVLATANELATKFAPDVPPLQVDVVGMRRRVRTAHGLAVPVGDALDAAAADWVVIPALGHKMPETLIPALERADVRDAAAALRECAASGAR